MPFKIANFGNEAAYQAWNGKRKRKYIIKLINNDLSTTEIVKVNPSGITKSGITLERDSVYHCVQESLTFEFIFSTKPLGGGAFLRTAYANKGIKANVTAEFYKYNPLTDDFDLLYNYKAYFSEWKDEVYTISVTFIQGGLWAKFASRDELDLDITKTTAIDGQTVSAIASSTKSMPAIDIILYGDSEEGIMDAHEVASYSGIGTDYHNFTGSTQLHDLTGDRITLGTPTGLGAIYTNSSDENKQVRFKSNFQYRVVTNCTGGATLTIKITVEYWGNGGGNVIETLATFTNNNEGLKDQTQTINYNGTYKSIYVGGYIRFRVSTDYNAPFPYLNCYVNSANFLGFYSIPEGIVPKHYIYEKSPSPGATNCKSYRHYDALLQGLRLITGVNNIMTSDSLTTALFYRNYITGGMQLRGDYTPNLITKFIDCFKAASYTEGIMLYYDFANNIFHIEPIEQAYQDALGIEFGYADDFKSYPSKDYYNEILCGCDTDGKYERDQGVLEFNVKHTFVTDFDLNNSLNLRVKYHTDSLAFEYTRRSPIYVNGSTDTEYDKDVFMFHTDASGLVQVDAMSGFEDVDQYYNRRFIARESIIANGGIIAPMFWKETGNYIKFSNNVKNINIYYNTPRSDTDQLTENIPQATLGEPFFYPEIIECTVPLTDSKFNDLRNYRHRYHSVIDKNGVTHYLYIDNVQVQDFEKKATIKGKRANINRS